MANRHLARSVVLQVLFERDASGGKMSMQDAEKRLSDYALEFGARESDMPFMKQLLQRATGKKRRKKPERCRPNTLPEPSSTPNRGVRRTSHSCTTFSVTGPFQKER